MDLKFSKAADEEAFKIIKHDINIEALEILFLNMGNKQRFGRILKDYNIY